MVGTGTLFADNPSLTTRLWPGENPTPITFKQNTDKELALKAKPETVWLESDNLSENLKRLWESGIQSILVEGGPTLLKSFIESDLWDEALVFEGNSSIGNGIKAPSMPTEGMNLSSPFPEKIRFYTNE
jgi:diaminohydroxyphosphoribosylaminopyrimidine deaminase/5-amino-6-(5-phosphoribosylamino)uracil reductase